MTSPYIAHDVADVRPPTPAALSVIGEMLDRLDSVTRAGQSHMMGKIVAVLSRHPLAAAGGPLITRQLDELRREANRVAPDGCAFAITARTLVATMTVRS